MQGENPENFMLHTQRGHHFVEIIVKYFGMNLLYTFIDILI